MAALGVFTNVMKSLGICSNTSVGIGVSGGSDSLALTLLAKQFFNCRVVGMTVDHQIRLESRQEALQVKSIVESIGIEHKLLTIDWPDGVKPPPGKVQRICRDQRYRMMLKECANEGLSALLINHHADDQMETFLIRWSQGSRFYGLACAQTCVLNPQYSLTIPIIRPLLTTRKCDLKQICSDNNVQWIEDSTNAAPICKRNCFRLALNNHPEVHHDFLNLIKMFQSARDKTNNEIHKAYPKISDLDKTNGYVTVKYSKFSELSPTVARKFLEKIIMYVRNNSVEGISSSAVLSIYNSIIKKIKTINSHGKISVKTQMAHGTCNGCIVFHHDRETFGVARRSNPEETLQPQYSTKIRLGETVHWDNRFDVSLHVFSQIGSFSQRGLSAQNDFYIRHMIPRDWSRSGSSDQKRRNFHRLPHVLCRNGLPVVIARRNDLQFNDWPVVAIPHLRFSDRWEFNVSCTCLYRPGRDFESYIQ